MCFIFTRQEMRVIQSPLKRSKSAINSVHILICSAQIRFQLTLTSPIHPNVDQGNFPSSRDYLINLFSRAWISWLYHNVDLAALSFWFPCIFFYSSFIFLKFFFQSGNQQTRKRSKTKQDEIPTSQRSQLGPFASVSILKRFSATPSWWELIPIQVHLRAFQR